METRLKANLYQQVEAYDILGENTRKRKVYVGNHGWDQLDNPLACCWCIQIHLGPKKT